MNSHHCKWLSSFLSPHPLTTEDRVSPVSKRHCPPIHGSLKLTRKCAVCELSRQKWKSFVFLFRCQCIYFYPPGFWWTESVESSSCCSSHEHQDEISLSEMSTILRTPSHWIPEDISASILVFMLLIPSFPFHFLPELLHDVATTNKRLYGKRLCLCCYYKEFSAD